MLMRCLWDRAVYVPQDVILIFTYMLPEQSMQNDNLSDHSLEARPSNATHPYFLTVQRP